MSFYSNILKYYDQLFPLDSKKLSYVLEEDSPQRILDIGCATGSLCHELYNKGHEVVGIDIDGSFIDCAQKKNPQGPQFKTMDMLDIEDHFQHGYFNQVLCFDNTLAHLPNEMAVRKFFNAMAGILAEGGKFKCDLVNYDQAHEKGMLNLPTVEAEGVVLKRHQSMEQQFMECYTELNVSEDDAIHKNCVPLFPIRFSQLKALLSEAGFNHINLYCNYEKCPPSGDHTYNVIEAWR